MQNLKLWIISIAAVALVSLLALVEVQHRKIVRINKELSTAIINNKAYERENDTLKNNAIQFELTVAQLNNSKDSIIQKLNDARKELKIKDKNIQQLQYIASQTQKKDSVFVKDTIFKEVNFALDTTLRDQWSSLNLQLKYPNYIAASYSFKNEIIIFHSSKKETVNPPKKFWLFRLFQKKHIVTEVTVKENNPYCTGELEKHVKITN